MTSKATALTAAEHALRLPEILFSIFSWIHEDRYGYWGYIEYYDDDGGYETEEPGYGHEGVLMRCGLVNKLWYAEAMPILWATPGTLGMLTSNSLPRFFSPIKSLARRQFYANFVQTATLVTVTEDAAAECDSALFGVTFPKSTSLKLILNHSCYVPRVEGHGFTELLIDPPFECNPDTYLMTRDQIGAVLDQIPVGFY